MFHPLFSGNRVTAACRWSTAKFDIDRGPPLAHEIDVVNFSAANLIGGFVFGSIGFVAFMYGKRMNLWKPMFLGLALMVYPYFVSNDIAMIVVGAIGSASLWFVRE
jgi:hypothetical protein